jgi:hypothetical protein
MAYVSVNPKRLVGESVGNGQCVAYVQAATQAGHTSGWRRGEIVMGANLAIGTAIATFDEAGRYINDTHGKSHAAIYLGQDAAGIQVLDQWVSRTPGTHELKVQPVHQRSVSFQNRAKPVNDGRNYYVIE